MNGVEDGVPATGRFLSSRSDEPFPGVSRRALTTKRVTVSHYTFRPGARFPRHHHPQEQITLVESGSVEMTIGRERHSLGPGAWAVVVPDVEHGITAGASGATVLAIVSPARVAADEYELSSEGGR